MAGSCQGCDESFREPGFRQPSGYLGSEVASRLECRWIPLQIDRSPARCCSVRRLRARRVRCADRKLRLDATKHLPAPACNGAATAGSRPNRTAVYAILPHCSGAPSAPRTSAGAARSEVGSQSVRITSGRSIFRRAISCPNAPARRTRQIGPPVRQRDRGGGASTGPIRPRHAPLVRRESPAAASGAAEHEGLCFRDSVRGGTAPRRARRAAPLALLRPHKRPLLAHSPCPRPVASSRSTWACVHARYHLRWRPAGERAGRRQILGGAIQGCIETRRGPWRSRLCAASHGRLNLAHVAARRMLRRILPSSLATKRVTTVEPKPRRAPASIGALCCSRVSPLSACPPLLRGTEARGEAPLEEERGHGRKRWPGCSLLIYGRALHVELATAPAAFAHSSLSSPHPHCLISVGRKLLYLSSVRQANLLAVCIASCWQSLVLE